MKRTITLGTVGLGILALGTSGLPIAPLASAVGPTATISVSPLLHEGDPITITGSGFTPGDHLAGQCILNWDAESQVWKQGDCAGTTVDAVTAAADGTINDTIRAAQGIQFGLGDEGPSVAVTPNANLADGQSVIVTGSNFPAFNNTFDCDAETATTKCGVGIWTLDMMDLEAIAGGTMAGMFAAPWSPPTYTISEAVTQQLESIWYMGDADGGTPWADNVPQIAAPIDRQTGSFSTTYQVQRTLVYTHVAYAIEGHPQPVWEQTWPPPSGLVPYDYTFDCANLPAKQTGRSIEELQCQIVVMDPNGMGNGGFQVLTFEPLNVTAQAMARIAKNGRSVDLTGTVSCPDPSTVHVTGSLTQPTRKAGPTVGYFTFDVPCTPGSSTAWATTTAPNKAKFSTGDAALTMNATSLYFTPVTSQQGTVTLTK